MEALGIKLTRRGASHLLNRIDGNGDGKISREELYESFMIACKLQVSKTWEKEVERNSDKRN